MRSSPPAPAGGLFRGRKPRRKQPQSRRTGLLDAGRVREGSCAITCRLLQPQI